MFQGFQGQLWDAHNYNRAPRPLTANIYWRKSVPRELLRTAKFLVFRLAAVTRFQRFSAL
jgi:hypothetical protein